MTPLSAAEPLCSELLSGFLGSSLVVFVTLSEHLRTVTRFLMF